LDVVGGDGAFAADAPEVAAEFDNRGRHAFLGFAGVHDQGDAVPQLAKNFLSAGARGRARDVGAGAGEGNAKFIDEATGDFVFGPAHGDAPAVGGDFEGEPVRSVNNNRERAGPASFRETVEIIGQFAGENQGLVDGIDENREGTRFEAAFDTKDLVDGVEIDGIGCESVERIGRNGDNRAALQPASGILHHACIGALGIELQDFSRQRSVPNLFWSGGDIPPRPLDATLSHA
jgi:hypothetical protein